jgi:hypothetical protein
MHRMTEAWWEHAGTVVSGVAWLSVAAQFCAEWRARGPSSLSAVNVFGFLLVFLFWTLYGLRFRRRAILVGNLVACVLQSALITVWLIKKRG